MWLKIKAVYNKNIKRYLISSFLSFLTGFLIVLVPLLNNLKLEDLKTGAWVGIIFVAIRAGLKALLEFVLASLNNK